jgi:putative exporter of polyketide antibiotics
MDYFVALSALVTIAWAEQANAQQIKAGVLTCDVSEGMGYIIGSKKLLTCSFAPEGAGRREDYDGSITKFGLDLGLTRGGFMVWSVFTNTVAGPGFLAGEYVGASGQATT